MDLFDQNGPKPLACRYACMGLLPCSVFSVSLLTENLFQHADKCFATNAERFSAFCERKTSLFSLGCLRVVHVVFVCCFQKLKRKTLVVLEGIIHFSKCTVFMFIFRVVIVVASFIPCVGNSLQWTNCELMRSAAVFVLCLHLPSFQSLSDFYLITRVWFKSDFLSRLQLVNFCLN